MASVIGKTVNGRTFYYLAESGRVGGAPRVVAQRYLGSAEDIAAALAGERGPAPTPTHTRHLAFGDVAAVWRVLSDLAVVDLVDGLVGSGRGRVSVGTYLALAVARQAVAPESEPGDVDLGEWWSTTAAQRFVRPRIDPGALDRRAFWRAMGRLGPERRRLLEAGVLDRLRGELAGGTDRAEPAGPVLVLDVPHFTTYAGPTDAGGDDPAGEPWLAGLAAAVTLDGAVPLTAELYRHGDPATTAFTVLSDRLTARYAGLGGQGRVTVVVDAGQSAEVDFAARAGRHFVASLPLTDHPELAARPATGRRAVDRERFPGVTALDTRARVAGVDRRVILVHSNALRAAQTQALARDLSSATRRLADLAGSLERRTLHRSREQVAAEVARITRFRWVERVLSTSLTSSDEGLRLRWKVDEAALGRLRHEVFGKQVLVTDHEDWPVADVLTAYRARYRLESTLRQFVAPVTAAPSPRWRWSDERVAVHSLVCLLATTAAHVMRRRAQHAGVDLSVRDLFARLAGIEETVVTYPSTGGRPRVRRVLVDLDPLQRQLCAVFGLDEWAPGRAPGPVT
ncbi:IS1634 family transposase [Actinopolymorpha singaporensis]|uniref:Transposase n=1 Tax=Actinopolymorpha singaporensis TaxID=117157 RepID=A0A1H1PP55_9ACTN|nr:transposase [Actinopolymorpha singaporensis]SDS12918.1 hypothetical protein SAMN04489717_1712 [Actinopolymorpha singaporensis]